MEWAYYDTEKGTIRGEREMVSVEFARQLEAELAKSQELNRKLVEALEMAIDEIKASDYMLEQGYVCNLTKRQMQGIILARKALEAAREAK